MDPSRSWHVVLPVKGGVSAKSRLGKVAPDRAALALAMAMDCLDAVIATEGVASVVVVTRDPATQGAARDLGADVLSPSVEGLGVAVRQALAAAAGTGSPDPLAVAVLLADVPALRAQDVRAALDAVEAALDDGAGWAFVPDTEATGTVLLAGASASHLTPAFGPGSARAHQRLGARRLDLPLDRLRRDVDTAASLAEAVRLGVGPRTRDLLGLVS